MRYVQWRPRSRVARLGSTGTGRGDTMDDVDLLVIGGGINGAGIARDASGRGLRVLLCESMTWPRTPSAPAAS